MSKDHTYQPGCIVGHLTLLYWPVCCLLMYWNHTLNQVVHCTNRPFCLRHLISKHPKSVFVPLLLVWERQYNTVFVFSSRLLWRGCNVLLLIGRLKFSEVLLLSESAVDLFSTRFHFHRLCFLFCQLTQQAHLSVFWGLSVGGWVIKRPHPQHSHPPLAPPFYRMVCSWF